MKVDVLRHQIDLAVVLPDGEELGDAESHENTDSFTPIAVLSED